MKRGEIARFCDLAGVSAQTASGLRRRGVLKDETAEGMVREYIHHLREQAAGRVAGGSIDLAAERAKLAEAQRRRIERQEREAARELVQVDAVIEAWCRLVGNCRSRLLAIPSKLGSRLGAATESASLAAAIADELIFEALDELSGDGLPAAEGKAQA